MKSYVKRDSTTIKGNIVISTVDQLSLLGDVGSNIKNEVNLQEIDNNKWYPREIRGKIHQKVIERFGEIWVILIMPVKSLHQKSTRCM